MIFIALTDSFEDLCFYQTTCQWKFCRQAFLLWLQCIFMYTDVKIWELCRIFAGVWGAAVLTELFPARGPALHWLLPLLPTLAEKIVLDKNTFPCFLSWLFFTLLYVTGHWRNEIMRENKNWYLVTSNIYWQEWKKIFFIIQIWFHLWFGLINSGVSKKSSQS